VGSRVILRGSADNLRRSYLKAAVGVAVGTLLDPAGGPSMSVRGQYDPSLELNYVDDPRLACGETFTRATLRTTRDFEGRTLTLNAGEVGFWGFRRVENLLNKAVVGSENLYAWSLVSATAKLNAAYRHPAGATVSELTPSALGGNASAQLNFSAGANGRFVGAVDVRDIGARFVSLFLYEATTGTDYTAMSVDLQTGLVTGESQNNVTDIEYKSWPIGDGWFRVVVRGRYVNPIVNMFLQVRANAQTILNQSLLATRAQVQERNGVAFRSTEEYVSVGLLPAPYHGANVDGVKYFATDTVGRPAARYTGTTIKYFQNVAAAGYASTPSTAALAAIVNLDIDVEMSKNSHSVLGSMAGKFQAGNGWVLQLTALGNVRLFDGGANIDSTAAVGFLAGDRFKARVVHTVTATNRITTFYTSPPGLAVDQWTQLGAAVVTAGGIAPVNNGEVSIGSYTAGTASPLLGIVFRMRLYDRARETPGATLLLDFNPGDAAAAGAANFVSSTTGETWTINGNGVTSRVNTWTKPGRRGILRERGSANGHVQSDALDDAAWTKGSTVITANAIAGPSGAITMDKVVADATNSLHNINATVAKAAAALPYTPSVMARAGELKILTFRIDVSGANGVYCSFDLLLGTVSVPATATGVGWVAGTATIEQLLPGVYRCTCPTTTDAGATIRGVYCVQDVAGNPFTPTTFLGDGVGGLYMGGMQLENLDHATSYIPTAAAAVTRDADLMNGPNIAAGWCNLVAGTWYCEVIPDYFDAGSARVVGLGAGSRTPLSFSAAGGGSTFDGTTGLVTVNMASRGARSKLASRYAVGGKSVVMDNGAVVADASNTFAGGNAFFIGAADAIGSLPYDGWIGRIWHYPLDIGDARMKPLTV
jgi:hypothetical protein